MADTAERRPDRGGAPDDARGDGTSVPTIPAAAVTGRLCGHCAAPLPPRRRRFCTDLCRRRGQRAERVTENGTYAAAVVRQIRSMGVRASADLDALRWLAGTIDHARDALALAVDGCRARAYSDGEIGAALGISRQAVGQRFGRKHAVHGGPPGSAAAG